MYDASSKIVYGQDANLLEVGNALGIKLQELTTSPYLHECVGSEWDVRPSCTTCACCKGAVRPAKQARKRRPRPRTCDDSNPIGCVHELTRC